MVFIFDWVGLAKQTEPRITKTLVVEIQKNETARHEIVMAVGKEPLADEARLKIAAGANPENTLRKRFFKTLDHVLLGALGVNLQKIGNNAKTAENIISTLGLNFQDLLREFLYGQSLR